MSPGGSLSIRIPHGSYEFHEGTFRMMAAGTFEGPLSVPRTVRHDTRQHHHRLALRARWPFCRNRSCARLPNKIQTYGKSPSVRMTAQLGRCCRHWGVVRKPCRDTPTRLTGVWAVSPPAWSTLPRRRRSNPAYRLRRAGPSQSRASPDAVSKPSLLVFDRFSVHGLVSPYVSGTMGDRANGSDHCSS
jgi:hypothetical protein